jgi:hypothetical protein
MGSARFKTTSQNETDQILKTLSSIVLCWIAPKPTKAGLFLKSDYDPT